MRVGWTYACAVVRRFLSPTAQVMLIVDNPGGTVSSGESQRWEALHADTIHPDCSGQVITDLLVDISLR
jgi:hypothetical protein